MIYQDITQTVGKTPLVKLNRLTDETMADVYVKVESFNPTSSVKDRAALYIINAAEKEGILKKGDTIIEPTSGNTGIAMAMIGAARGYRVIIVMSETMSLERRQIIEAFGAEIILTKKEAGTQGSVDLAEKYVKEKGYFMPNQFANKNNTIAHLETTAEEIYHDLDGKIDAFVAGVGTGGTISGSGRKLKSYKSDIKIIAVEPESSPLITTGTAGPHKIQGMGANFIPGILEQDILDDVLTMPNELAYTYARRLAREEGILAGISSGANVAAAIEVAKKLGPDHVVVTVLPDTGERYLSTDLFNEEIENA